MTNKLTLQATIIKQIISLKHFTVDYQSIKTLKIKTYKTQQSVSLVNGIIRGKSKQLFWGKSKNCLVLLKAIV